MNQGANTNFIDDNIGKKYFEIIRKKTVWEEYVYDIEKQITKVKIRSKMKAGVVT